jgi:hypothetical protein
VIVEHDDFALVVEIGREGMDREIAEASWSRNTMTSWRTSASWITANSASLSVPRLTPEISAPILPPRRRTFTCGAASGLVDPSMFPSRSLDCRRISTRRRPLSREISPEAASSPVTG